MLHEADLVYAFNVLGAKLLDKNSPRVLPRAKACVLQGLTLCSVGGMRP
jgi:hypothetical protein